MKVFILACDIKYTNTDKEESPDYLVNKIIKSVEEQEISFIYGIKRRKLSNGIGLFKSASCIGILDPSGVFPELKRLPIDYPLQIITSPLPPSSSPSFPPPSPSPPPSPLPPQHPITPITPTPATDSSIPPPLPPPIQQTEELVEKVKNKPLNINAKEFKPK